MKASTSPTDNREHTSMREIKFRAWYKREKRWYKGGAIQLTAMMGNSFGLSEPNGKIIELQQYTGLKDKNGVEVYEGDIIDTTIKAQRIAIVVWDEGALTWGLADPKSGHKAGDGYLDATMSYVEVIGNIYDTPELPQNGEKP